MSTQHDHQHELHGAPGHDLDGHTHGHQPATPEKMAEVLRKAGVKLTHQRLEILRELAAQCDHPDAETIFTGVRQRVPTVSLDTVYRTLNLLVEHGLLSTLGPARERTRFDTNPHNHHHFVCIKCGRALDFEASEFDALPVPRAAAALGLVLSAQVELRGVCAGCAVHQTEDADGTLDSAPVVSDC